MSYFNTPMDFNAPTGFDLCRGRAGSKIHSQGCGHRSRRMANMRGTGAMTRVAIVEMYGTDLCKYCFPEAHQPAVEAPEAPAAPVVEETPAVEAPEAPAVEAPEAPAAPVPAVRYPAHVFINHLVHVSKQQPGGDAVTRIVLALSDRSVASMHDIDISLKITGGSMKLSVVGSDTALDLELTDGHDELALAMRVYDYLTSSPHQRKEHTMIITDNAAQTTYTTTDDMLASFTDAPEEISTAAQELASMLDSWEAGAVLNHDAQELADYLGLTIA